MRLYYLKAILSDGLLIESPKQSDFFISIVPHLDENFLSSVSEITC